MKTIRNLLLLSLTLIITNCQNKSDSPSPTPAKTAESRSEEKESAREKSEKNVVQTTPESPSEAFDAFIVYSQIASKTSSSNLHDRLWESDKNISAEQGAKWPSLSVSFKEIKRDENNLYFQFNSDCSFVNSSGLATSHGMGSNENQSYLILSRSGTISRECGYYGRFEIGKLTESNLNIKLVRCSDLYERKTMGSALDVELNSDDTIKVSVSIRSYFNTQNITRCSGILSTKR
ncbi:MAG: hypothetical protein JNL11_09530 [Bdellovibrionaceae bacterium]|nr:hypothetical protein [Pseudobdellovibrionaceae bacterium]